VYRVLEPLQYHRRLLSAVPSQAELLAVAADYAAMLVEVMTAIADRYERRPNYPFIDTKINLMTGADFSADDPLRGFGTISGWIQGRGLEALVEHCRWLRSHPEIAAGRTLIPRLEQILREVSQSLWAIFRRNQGHVFFFMTPQGSPFLLQADGKPREMTTWAIDWYSYSDLFVAKGLYAAAVYRSDTAAAADARAYCYAIDQAIWADRFISNEKEVDLQTGLPPRGSRCEQGPYMIQLGTAAVLTDLGRDPAVVEMGLRLLRHQLGHFVQVAAGHPDFRPGDAWEAIEPDGSPVRTEEGVSSNPGHAIELVGLGLKFTAAARHHGLGTPKQAREIAELEAFMPTILDQQFQRGFRPDAGGICLRVDLIQRKPLSDIMPWWSLPETIRAAMESWSVSTDPAGQRRCLEILSQSHNAFAQHYVRPELHLMAYQTRSTAGHPVAVIPATADADPGYHTGVSILDFLRILDSLPEL